MAINEINRGADSDEVIEKCNNWVKQHGLDEIVFSVSANRALISDDNSLSITKRAMDGLSKHQNLKVDTHINASDSSKWGHEPFNNDKNFRLLPHGRATVDQCNVEHLSNIIESIQRDHVSVLEPEVLVTNHTKVTSSNALGILTLVKDNDVIAEEGIAQATTCDVPKIIGIQFRNKKSNGVSGIDVALFVAEKLSHHEIDGSYIEFYGSSLKIYTSRRQNIDRKYTELSGAKCVFFPIDGATMSYKARTGTPQNEIKKIAVYAKKVGLWRYDDDRPYFPDSLTIKLNDVVPAVAGPNKISRYTPLNKLKYAVDEIIEDTNRHMIDGFQRPVHNGDVVFASIYGSARTCNPQSMMRCALFARNVVERGGSLHPNIISFFGPGSDLVHNYLDRSGLQKYMDLLGFQVQPMLLKDFEMAAERFNEKFLDNIEESGVRLFSVTTQKSSTLSKHMAKRIQNFIASPITTIAFSIVGSVRVNLLSDPIFYDDKCRPVFMRDLFPTDKETNEYIKKYISKEDYINLYK